MLMTTVPLTLYDGCIGLIDRPDICDGTTSIPPRDVQSIELYAVSSTMCSADLILYLELDVRVTFCHVCITPLAVVD